MSRLEQQVKELVPEAQTVIASAGQAGGGGGGGGSAAAAQPRYISALPRAKDQRTRSSEQIAFDLRRQLLGHSRRHRSRECERRQQPDQPA
jgi:hypothetical protein